MSCFRLMSLFAVTATVSLMLGPAPRDARAGVCGDLNEPAGCVVPDDFRKNAVRSKHRMDEAGTDFQSKLNIPREISGSPQVYASVVVDVPAAGTVIVNASITIQAFENPGPGTGPGVTHGRGGIECALTDGGSFIALNNPNRFFGSVDWKEGIPYETIAITRGFSPNRKISSTIALSCKLIPGGSDTSKSLIRVRSPSISAAYYSNVAN